MNNNPNYYRQDGTQGQPQQYGGGHNGSPRRNGNPLMWVIVALLVVIIVMLVVFMTCDRNSTSEVLDNNPAAAEQAKPAADTVKVVTKIEELPAEPAEPVVVDRPGYDGSYTLSGKVGPARSNISLKISKNGTISGTERYAKGGGAAILLSGTCSSNGTVHIDETYQGDWCGTFDGKIIKNGSNVSFKGSFLNSRGTGYNFNLSGTRN